jgi:hypothetical protein
MAIATELITRPEEAIAMLKEVIDDNAGLLGIEFVGSYEERLIPRYPAVVISAGIATREVHATHTLNVTLRCILWVYHAVLTETHTERNKQDLELATAVIALIENDKTFDNKVIFGFVESETPGVLAARLGRSDAIVGTRLAWEGLTQQRWD